MKANDDQRRSMQQAPPKGNSSGTMHDHTETWTDTCSCEPEPRWQAVEQELEERAWAKALRDGRDA